MAKTASKAKKAPAKAKSTKSAQAKGNNLLIKMEQNCQKQLLDFKKKSNQLFNSNQKELNQLKKKLAAARKKLQASNKKLSTAKTRFKKTKSASAKQEVKKAEKLKNGFSQDVNTLKKQADSCKGELESTKISAKKSADLVNAIEKFEKAWEKKAAAAAKKTSKKRSTKKRKKAA